MTKKELTPGEVVSAVKISLATARLDARIAWEVLKGLQDTLLAGPWEEVQEDSWQRNTYAGLIVSAVCRERDENDKIIGARGRLGRGHWLSVYANEEVAFPGEPLPRVGASEALCFHTVEEAMVHMDSKLHGLGWALVQPLWPLP